MRVDVEDGRVEGVRGDKDYLPTRGFICPKGSALKGLHHDPDRLRRPLVRRPFTPVMLLAFQTFARELVDLEMLPGLPTHNVDPRPPWRPSRIVSGCGIC